MIVSAAAELMHEHGIAHTSLDDVLAHSGAGKSQLYHYFANKRELVAAVISHQLSAVIEGQPRLTQLTSWGDFDRWATAFVSRHEGIGGPRACRLGRFAAEVDDDPELSGLLLAAFEQWRGHLQRGLEHLRDTGRLDPAADPEALSTGLLAALQGGIVLARLAGDAEPLRRSLALALDGLRAHARTPGSRRRAAGTA
ncbi:AcrR family transcriptional regulator [Friedmanniella endophytica]|uniref:AcrR family transcriptional regulator n=1 Tax=Microlunatus kandeliicorticis TaxID=1759536 RepID=A0A7W3IPU5_9ACTN|nr:TetR/AcrR family transcriptional regulator [Microlunatus kandeliicorticis]MBA8793031.1 AcrR family transcriptional regulator [Microlunatus kandeliicorticis]